VAVEVAVIEKEGSDRQRYPVVEYSDRVGDATWQRGRPIGSYPNIEEVRMQWSGPTARDDAVVQQGGRDAIGATGGQGRSRWSKGSNTKRG
jgi:hypothetical protein